MNFSSDNYAPAAPEILAAVVAANKGYHGAYGGDVWTERLNERFSALFECEVSVFPVLTGGAANCLALSVLVPPYGVIYCHEEAHIETSEGGGPEFFTGGAKLGLVPGAQGKIDPAALERRIAGVSSDVHWPPPAAVSITQVTESGTLYRSEEIAAIAGIAHRHGLPLHMDGARFGNAVAALDVSPAALTWQAGVDVLSFGATKNGALLAEAVIFFDHALARDFERRRKRAQQLASKMRYVSAQLDCYIADGLWLRLARRANGQARRLAAGLARIPDAILSVPVEANEIFVTLPEATLQRLEAAGAHFYRWDADTGQLIRLVTNHATTDEEVERFLDIAGEPQP